METTFYLKKNIVYFLFTHNKLKIRKSTGKKIDPKLWGTGFPKVKKDTKELRDVLSGYKKNIDSYIDNVIEDKNRPPSANELSEHLKLVLGQKQSSTGVSELIDYYLRYSEIHFGEKTNETKKIHLEDFRKHCKGLEVYDLDKTVFTKYINKLIKKDIELETINSYIKDIKACFSRLCIDNKLETDFSHNKYLQKYPSKKKPIIALRESELNLIESYDLQSERLQKVIDMFLFGCYTGLRYEDLNSFTITDLDGGKQQINIAKTGDNLNIPIISEAKRILEKYNYQLPTKSNQKANDYLKEAFKQYGLNRKVAVQRNYVNRIETDLVPLCDTISFHKSRKTFITTALRRKIDKRIVMKLAGIVTDEVFQRYVDYESEEGNEAMNTLFSKGEANKPMTHSAYAISELVKRMEANFNKVKNSDDIDIYELLGIDEKDVEFLKKSKKWKVIEYGLRNEMKYLDIGKNPV